MRAKSLTSQFGGRWHGSYGTARCPAHDDRRPSLSLKDGDSGRLLLFCHAGCSYQEIVAAIEAHAGALVLRTDAWERPEARVSCGPPISALINLIWSQTVSIQGTLAERYIRGRSISGPIPSQLRFHRNLRHPEGLRFPAMVGRVEAVDLGVVGLHRTYLMTDAPKKIDHPTSKAMLGPCKGGAVRLRTGNIGLAVAEGVETALSLAMGLESGIAVWAALSASGMAALRLPPPKSVGGLLIVGTDGEPRGRSAGAELAGAAARRGWTVEIIRAQDGKDFNDMVQGGANG